MKLKRIVNLISRYLIFTFISVYLSSCRGLIDYIKERQQATHGHVTYSSTLASIEKKWGVKFPPNTDEKLVLEMDSWLGIPYKYGGNSKNGTDCSGMIQQIYKNVYGIQLHRSAFDMQKDVELISLEKAKLGDIVFFKIDQNKVSHVGLYIGDKKFIHASTSKGVIISSLDEDYYKTRFYAMGRVKGKK